MSEQQEGFAAVFWRWRERWRAWRDEKKPLREFVYLDETSVYSLYASRFGEIKSERTDTLTRVQQSEAGGSLGPISGAAGGGLTARAMSSQSQQSQVVSRAIVQSTFKDLLEKERTSLLLQHAPHFEKTPQIKNLDGLRAGRPSRRCLKKLRKKGFVVDSRTLTRGALLEIEVELEPESIFKFNSVVQELSDMVKKNPAIFGHNEEEIDEMKSVSNIIEQLLVGLIPLRGRAVDYSVVVFDSPDDGSLIVHNKLIESLEDKSGFTTHPLFVVGVAEDSLFWKDIRRVLFAGQRFRLLCRVAQDGISETWIPLKLQQVVSSVFPELGEAIEEFSRGDMFRAELDGTSVAETDLGFAARNALLKHARFIAKLNGVELSESEIAEVDAVVGEHLSSFDTAQEKREAFKIIEEHMANRYELEIDPEAAKDSRLQAKEDVSVSQLVQSDSQPGTDIELRKTPETRNEEYFLDSEFVAIYW